MAGKVGQALSLIFGIPGKQTKDLFFGSDPYQPNMDLRTRGGAEYEEELAAESGAAQQDAMLQAQNQLDMAAGFSQLERDSGMDLASSLGASKDARLAQLGMLAKQGARAERGTLVSDLEQGFAESDLNSRAATSALAGAGPLGIAAVQQSLGEGAPERGMGFAAARSQEVAGNEDALLGSFGDLGEQDIAMEHLTNSVILSQLSNAQAQQEQLMTGSARLELGAEQNLFRLRNAELQAQDALRAMEANRPRREGMLGGLMGTAGAIVGGIYGGPGGAAAGGAAGGAFGGAVQDAYSSQPSKR